MAFIDKAALLRPPTLKRETVQVGPLGGEVVMRELTVGERLAARKRLDGADMEDPEESTRAVLALVVSCLCNEDGTPMFPDEEWSEAVEGLMQQSNPAVEQLMAECLRIQGMGADSVKDAVKNSEASPSDSLSSGSPETSATLRVAP